MCAVGALGSAIQDTLCASHCGDVVIDLAWVTFLDCAGIGALVAGRNTAVTKDAGFAVANPPRQVRQVLELTGVLVALTWRPQSPPVAGRAARSRHSERHCDDRRVAADWPVPWTAGVHLSTNRDVVTVIVQAPARPG
jgi:anti-anti-sigma factor